MKSWVDISIAGRATERHRLGDDTTTVGRSPPSDIVLGAVDGLMPEHFSLRPQPEGCWVELVESAPEPFTFDGRPSRGCLVPWGQELFYGSVRMSLQNERPAESAKRSSPILWVALMVVPLALLSVVYKPGASSDLAGAAELKPPALFGPPPPCSESGAGALGRASIAEQIAFAKNQRGVFDLRDAVDAVELMREASQCYVLAGLEGKADRANAQTEAWMDKLRFTYQRTLLDLELAMRGADTRQTIRFTNRLTDLLTYAGPDAAGYKAWLDLKNRGQVAQHVIKLQEKKKR